MDPGAELDRRIAAAEVALRAELGDATACTLHRDGRVTGGMKYHEGRLVAYLEAKRALAGADPTLAAQVARWEEEFLRRTGAERPSPPWVAYATGGLEATREVIGLLREPDPGR